MYSYKQENKGKEEKERDEDRAYATDKCTYIPHMAMHGYTKFFVHFPARVRFTLQYN